MKVERRNVINYIMKDAGHDSHHGGWDVIRIPARHSLARPDVQLS